MLKPIVEIYPVIPAESEEARAQIRPAGRNRGLYQQTLAGWKQIIQHADQIGFWGAAAIEHHFHSEGYEVGPNPGVINAYMASFTKNLHLGQLGYVLGTHDPIRVAEETAILDHLTRGRSFVGLARGYQSRWTGVLGQHYGARATKSPGAALNAAAAAGGFTQSAIDKRDLDDDKANRAAFEEHVEILLKAWTQESFNHSGKNWQIPYPYEAGIQDWPLAKAGVTQRLGAEREIDAQGVLREVCVTPAPYTSPHPPVFLSGSGSPETIEFAARQDFHPVYFCNVEMAQKLATLYQTVSRECGRERSFGEKQAMVRWIYIGRTDEEAYALATRYDSEIWKNLYGAMGRRASTGDPMKNALETGLLCIGSVETVRRQLIDQFSQMPAEHLVMIYHYAQTPLDFVMENMTLFIEKVKPAIDEVLATRATA
ncbi:MAG: hypothetical protein BGP06_17370 [Rhizobiales bacterium 65-9]|nr:LLM class flavin-dependent oxidoreductase [Hyphomicrobiales bacterium]OJY40204.1 MAG: hypothetical protein BGP06_17370 [Rhizobiales bacterium 65-9]